MDEPKFEKAAFTSVVIAAIVYLSLIAYELVKGYR